MTRGLQALCIAGLALSLVVQVVGLHGAPPWLTLGLLFGLLSYSVLLLFVCAAFHPEANVHTEGVSTTVQLSVWHAVRVCPRWLRVSLIIFCVAEVAFFVVVRTSLGFGSADSVSGIKPPAPALTAVIAAVLCAYSFCVLGARRRLNPFAP